VHVSSSPEEAEREIKLWFRPEEIIVELYPARESVEKEKRTLAWA